ncbi:BTAD domain-containing putative transcriptional regulator [Streptomyces sp. NPDC048483]|uniref:AfsR/SARP family transcriptional regulator n=1 Tax=Streptomyces sp. NPDC048483 TaxID=3154927 RepID=UPI0034452995
MAELRLLGAVELMARGQAIDLGPPKQRAVFAALAVDSGQPVAVSTLVDRVWNESPPAAARNALYAHITRIRRLLADTTKADGSPVQLERHAGGYLLDFDPDGVDLLRFRRLAELALSKDLDDGARVVLLREALELWRGRPLEGVDGSWATWTRAHFDLYRVEAVVAWARIELELGNHEAVIPRVHALIGEHPLAEPLAAGLMRGLHAAGRDAEALEVFAAMRRRLVEELGAEPGAELRSIYQSVLRGEVVRTVPAPPDPAPARPERAGATHAVLAQLQGTQFSVPQQRAAPVDPEPARRAPCTLPAGIPDFAGRADVVSELIAACQEVGRSGERTMVVLSGAAGAGKTTVAVHVAHRLRAAFPAGQLYLRLHGLSAPPAPAEAVGQLLRALGVPHSAVPQDPDECSALLRSLTVDRRYLFVLDDAADEAQVRPLLPGAGSVVLVTSRRPLSGLEGAQRLELGSFSDAEALRLLGLVVGEERVMRDPAAAADIVRCSAGLPLAVRIVASRLKARPDRGLATAAAELADEGRRLDLFATGDLDVRASIGLSYRALTAEHRRVLRRVCLLDAPDVPAWVFATAAGLPRTGTDAVDADGGRRRSGPVVVAADLGAAIVDDLLAMHLIESAGVDEAGQPRYRLHDLVRAYARERVIEEDGEADRQAMLTWLLVVSHFSPRITSGPGPRSQGDPGPVPVSER